MPFNVYVIELDRKVLNNTRFRRKNPNHREDKPCVYVGATAHSPEKRFEQHKAGIRCNNFARDFGVRLRPRNYKKYQGFKTRKEAEKAERQRAKALRERGYAVWQG